MRDQPPVAFCITPRLATATVHQHISECNDAPNSWKDMFTTIALRLFSGLSMFPGVNSPHPTSSFQGDCGEEG